MLDPKGEPFVDFWVSEIIEWGHSELGPERVDIVARWGSGSPRADVRPVWERWLAARPDRINQWAVYGPEGRRAWLEIVRRARQGRARRGDRPAGVVYRLDGTHVADEVDFFLALGEAVNGPGGYFGCNLAALDDCLMGGFGAGTPFTLVCDRSPVVGGSLVEVLEGRGVRVIGALGGRSGR